MHSLLSSKMRTIEYITDVEILLDPMNTESTSGTVIAGAVVAAAAFYAVVKVVEDEALGDWREVELGSGYGVDEGHGLGGLVQKGEPAAGRATDDLVTGSFRQGEGVDATSPGVDVVEPAGVGMGRQDEYGREIFWWGNGELAFANQTEIHVIETVRKLVSDVFQELRDHGGPIHAWMGLRKNWGQRSGAWVFDGEEIGEARVSRNIKGHLGIGRLHKNFGSI